MKRLLFVLWLLALAVAAKAQTRVVDEAGVPMIGAVVLDKNGTPIGIVDKDGLMPELPAHLYPLTLRSLGFENITVKKPTAQLVMKETAYELGEVVFNDSERPACRVVCYIRETSGMMNDQDTMCLTAQYMADFMFKANPKAKKVPTWSLPRELNRQVEMHSASGKTLDCNQHSMLTWYDITCQLSAKEVKLPAQFKGKTSGTVTLKSKKTGNDQFVLSLSPSQFSVFLDRLADDKDHKWTPAAFKIIAATMDINEFWSKTTYNISDDGLYNLRNLVAKTYSLKILGRGKIFRVIFGGKKAVEITSYIEVFPVAIENLTRDEAKALKKDKQATYPITKPAHLDL